MNDIKKQELLEQSKNHLKTITNNVSVYQQSIITAIQRIRTDLLKEEEDHENLVEMLIHSLETQKRLAYSYKSPYFVRCDVQFDDEKEIRELYFGRFSLRDDSIYSWVAPAASIRFETTGRFSYELPNGKKRSGMLLRKDQFMIVDGKIFFLSTEATTYPRELVYQEYFSQKKQGFMLPEIVEQMEKAQDTIIRSHHYGSFLVSGAAGSGKTTLALHRVAYLVQSPETEKLFQPSAITVFVQDASTKAYFSGLLPELGIYRVTITTFDEWAMKILNIIDMQFIRRYGATEEEKDQYEYSKNIALQTLKSTNSEKELTNTLEIVYSLVFTSKQQALLKKQLQEKKLDRFDLTILLKTALLKDQKLFETVEKYKKQTNGKYVKNLIRQPILYSLTVIDEAENYLTEQIQLIKTCSNPQTNAVIYVGDLIQQTLLWTMKNWDSVNEQFQKDRQVILQNVYRNTKQILEYIQSCGFSIEIPLNIKEGKKVLETILTKKSDEIIYVTKIIEKNLDKTIGILAKTDEYLEDYRKQFSKYKNIHIMTINEAQGVEFDIVILVGINKELYQNNNLSKEIRNERQRVNSDLLYVACTRAISELHISGNSTVKELLALRA